MVHVGSLLPKNADIAKSVCTWILWARRYCLTGPQSVLATAIRLMNDSCGLCWISDRIMPNMWTPVEPCNARSVV